MAPGVCNGGSLWCLIQGISVPLNTPLFPGQPYCAQTTAVMAPGSAVKWVSTNAEAKLNVSPAATNLLVNSTRPAAPVNLVSILGPARNGKSSLMNNIVGTGDTFAMSDSVKACTKGGDLSRSVVRLADLENTDRYQSDWAGSRPTPSRGPNEDIYVAFADVEGQGDESEEHDVRLSTPFLLLSKVPPF